MGLALPLVGRREELALFDEALTTPGTSGVVFAGAAGRGEDAACQGVAQGGGGEGLRGPLGGCDAGGCVDPGWAHWRT